MMGAAEKAEIEAMRQASVGALRAVGLEPDDIVADGLGAEGFYEIRKDSEGRRIYSDDGILQGEFREWPKGVDTEPIFQYAAYLTGARVLKTDREARADRIAARVEVRIRDEWPGVRTTERRGEMVVPPIRKGGMTEELLKLALQIVREEVAAA